MRKMKLFNRKETVYRNNGEGYYDDDHNYVPAPETTKSITCNIQPYQDGVNNFRVPEGFKSIDAIEVRSIEELVPYSEVEETVGDEIEYRGLRYLCIDLAYWDGHTVGVGGRSMIPNHYLGLFYRKDKV